MVISKLTGRELDKAVAERIFKLNVVRYERHLDGVEDYGFKTGRRGLDGEEQIHILPYYSTQISAAMTIPQKMKELQRDNEFSDKVSFNTAWTDPVEGYWLFFYGDVPTAELICKSALEALERTW